MVGKEIPERLKRRGDRLKKIGEWVVFHEPPLVPGMIFSDEEYKEKFPDRFKRMKKWERHVAFLKAFYIKLEEDLLLFTDPIL